MKRRTIFSVADFRFPVLPISAIGKFKKNGIFKVLMLVLLFIFFQINVNALEATRYFNGICGITGIYDSEEYGILFSNSTGLYKLDKETGERTLIPYQDSLSLPEMETFFRYNGDIYFYKEYSYLYKMEGDVSVSVTDIRVVGHYVSGNKLYLISYKEPRIIVLEDGAIKDFSLGDTKGEHLYAQFAEVGGEIYAYVGLNWTGSRYIVKIKDNELEYLMSPVNPNHEAFSDLFPSKIFSINNELWIGTHYGMYMIKNNVPELVDTNYEFTKSYSYALSCRGDSVFGINQEGAYVANIQTKETRYLVKKELDYKHNLQLYEGEELIYYLIDDSIYTYNKVNHDFLHVEYNVSGIIMHFLEGIGQELIIAKYSRIELYKDGNQKFYEENTVVTNEFYDVCYDRANERIVALGRINDQFILQFYDGIRWDTLYVPFQYSPYDNTIMMNVNVEADFNGNYYVGVEDFMGVWDGTDWNIISVTEDMGDTTEYSQGEEYHVLLLDSLGYVWASAYRHIIDSATGYERGINMIFKFSGAEYEIIEENAKYDHVAYFINGICLTNGDIYLNSWGEEIYSYINREGLLFTPEDGDDHPFQKSRRLLCENSKGQFVVAFEDFLGWSAKYGSLKLPGNVSILDGESWDHEYYTDIVNYYNISFDNLFFISDPYGNDLMISEKQYICVGPDGSHVSGPIDSLDIYTNSQMFLNGKELWFSNSQQGLFKIDLPYISDVDEKQYNNEPYSLLANTVISGNYLELIDEIKSYKVYSLEGKPEASGADERYINTVNLNNGLHFIVYEYNGKIISEKFLINR